MCLLTVISLTHFISRSRATLVLIVPASAFHSNTNLFVQSIQSTKFNYGTRGKPAWGTLFNHINCKSFSFSYISFRKRCWKLPHQLYSLLLSSPSTTTTIFAFLSIVNYSLKNRVHKYPPKQFCSVKKKLSTLNLQIKFLVLI